MTCCFLRVYDALTEQHFSFSFSVCLRPFFPWNSGAITSFSPSARMVNQVLALFGYEVGAVPAGKEHSV